ncbi:hypothetical protein GH714_029095 [Hevea brasiliensis]|uniref:Peptidase S8/S53 domain-containing protein n=1 Tax=Hevea brasiliensis TaxID=3981 RepID=A0A6A6LEB4_HEVBR|nr:hypothetical protein GH714_029095 [Hevea brasiliensis]
MEEIDAFVSARPERKIRLLTTHSPSFLGLHQQMGFWKESNFGKGVIIGVLDAAFPSHPSFSDKGMPPPPAKWKGRSSTAAGGFVDNADTLGNAKGTAVGMAPYAHLAFTKCALETLTMIVPKVILAGLDTAVQDDVDVLSLSLAGNSGPFNATLSNEAPWILTVGASNIDRRIAATAKLGNGEELDGESVFQPSNFPKTLLPLVYAGMNGKPKSALCAKGALEDMDVKDKVVLCERGGGIARIAKGEEVKNAGGAAMILMNDETSGFSTIADPHVLPATHVSFAAGLKIKAYINSTKTPTATILFKGTVIGDPLSPAVTSFSSRGPSLASPGILKPDYWAWCKHSSRVAFPLDNNTDTKSTFNIMSGTSMACPHLSGIAALLKSSHPDWSPAAIKSAIMTTADILNMEGKSIVDETRQPADIFATGAGHVNPSRANDPGLIYDIQPDDYVPYLCGLGYKDEQTFTRTVTNVGYANSVYVPIIVPPPGVEVSVKPPKLYFSQVNQKATYSVAFRPIGNGGKTSKFAQGYISWVSAKHFVRSPISVRE